MSAARGSATATRDWPAMSGATGTRSRSRLNPAWTRSYAAQPEILEYSAQDGDRSRPVAVHPVEHRHRVGRVGRRSSTWVVTTDAGEEIVADVVISGQGMFGELKYPDIDGRDSFGGVAMHTGAWDESVDLTGKRVAMIGSAARRCAVHPQIAKGGGPVDRVPAFAELGAAEGDKEHTPSSSSSSTRTRLRCWRSTKGSWPSSGRARRSATPRSTARPSGSRRWPSGRWRIQRCGRSWRRRN